MSQDEIAIRFCTRLGVALHRYGAAAPRVEQAMKLTAQRLGLESQLFATPTSIFASFGRTTDQRTILMRVEPGVVHLDKRCRLDELVGEVLAGDVGPEEGSARLEALEAEADAAPAVVTVAAFTLASAAAARFFDGGWTDQGASAVVGFAIGLLSLVAARNALIGRLFEPASAVLAALVGVLTNHLDPDVSAWTVTVAGIIILLPGLTFTTAITELAMQHLSSGTARLMASILTFLGLGFGVAVGRRIGEAIATPIEPPARTPATWTLWLALAVAPVAFAPILRARWRDVPWMIVAGIVAFAGARLGVALLGDAIGAFIGAFLIGAASNAWARLFRRTSLVPLLPGILLLVPGSIGFRSFAALLEGQVEVGIETAFAMALTAISLVAGLVVGNIVVPPRQLDVAGT